MSDIDRIGADELKLFCDNDGALYRQRFKPIQTNLRKKLAKSTYDPTKAPKAWIYLVDACAKKYAQEFASPRNWHTIFPKATRMAVARDYADEFEREARTGDFHGSRNGTGILLGAMAIGGLAIVGIALYLVRKGA